MNIPDRSVAHNMPAEQLMALVESGNPDAMSVGTDGLIHQGVANQDYLLTLLKHENPLTRWGAVMAFSHMESAVAGAALKDALSDDNISIRLIAAHGLLNRGDQSGAEIIRQALDSDEILYGHPPLLASDRARQLLERIDAK
tara:strand:+ start:68 stop:493 length:426 start_codon:yes stop_codon:yes gene_type:complete